MGLSLSIRTSHQLLISILLPGIGEIRRVCIRLSTPVCMQVGCLRVLPFLYACLALKTAEFLPSPRVGVLARPAWWILHPLKHLLLPRLISCRQLRPIMLQVTPWIIRRIEISRRLLKLLLGQVTVSCGRFIIYHYIFHILRCLITPLFDMRLWLQAICLLLSRKFINCYLLLPRSKHLTYRDSISTIHIWEVFWSVFVWVQRLFFICRYLNTFRHKVLLIRCHLNSGQLFEAFDIRKHISHIALLLIQIHQFLWLESYTHFSVSGLSYLFLRFRYQVSCNEFLFDGPAFRFGMSLNHYKIY